MSHPIRYLSMLSPPPRPADVPARSPDWLHGIRILIVEDEADSRELLRQIVASFGATVRVAEEGHEALAIASAWTPDLILADLRMPRMDGFTLFRRLRDDPRLCRIRVVAVSALATGADIKRTWLAGFDGHVAKPIDYDLVATLIERLFWAHS
jgi:two-component system CheB/CheR fusion protein